MYVYERFHGRIEISVGEGVSMDECMDDYADGAGEGGIRAHLIVAMTMLSDNN